MLCKRFNVFLGKFILKLKLVPKLGNKIVFLKSTIWDFSNSCTTLEAGFEIYFKLY